jgi:hypothetical protein
VQCRAQARGIFQAQLLGYRRSLRILLPRYFPESQRDAVRRQVSLGRCKRDGAGVPGPPEPGDNAHQENLVLLFINTVTTLDHHRDTGGTEKSFCLSGDTDKQKDSALRPCRERITVSANTYGPRPMNNDLP